MRLTTLLLCTIPFFLDANPQQTQKKLKAATQKFDQALGIFDPWYTGPLLTPSATLMPIGEANTQPYLFFTSSGSIYNKERNAVELEHTLFTFKSTANIQTGIANYCDLNVTASALYNSYGGVQGGGWGDLNATLGLLVCRETIWAPQIKFTLAENFPTGRYEDLTPGKAVVQATGLGAYSTQVGVAFSKLMFWKTQHPTRLRFFGGWQFPTDVALSGFNSYGGGYGTEGTILPNNTVNLDLGGELSLTRRWVLACDVVYTYTDATRFFGDAGTHADGSPALVGLGFSDNLSIAPAIEYNWNNNLGLIMGAWFSVYGRESAQFATGIVSLSVTWP